MNRFFAWISDLFGRKKIVATHKEIVHEMVETTELARTTIQRRKRSFPISRTIGNQRLRRGVHYAK
jgi:hypothetical protein